MAGKKYYFSHDVNASQDTKIQSMMTIYGAEGYGWYWMLLEMMHDEEGYKLKLTGKYVFKMLARKLFAEPEIMKQYIKDCIEEFELFISDGEYFFSKSFIGRMQKRDDKMRKASASASKRWEKTKNANALNSHKENNENGMRTHKNNIRTHKKNANALNSHANASKNDAIKERKGKERKEYIYSFDYFLNNGAEQWIKDRVRKATLSVHKKYNAPIINTNKINESDLPWGLIYTLPNSEKFYYNSSDGRKNYNP